MSSSPRSEKPDVAELEVSHHERQQHGSNKIAEKDRIDAIAEAPGTTMASFAHLDEKKILRKVCWVLGQDHFNERGPNFYPSRWICD